MSDVALFQGGPFDGQTGKLHPWVNSRVVVTRLHPEQTSGDVVVKQAGRYEVRPMETPSDPCVLDWQGWYDV